MDALLVFIMASLAGKKFWTQKLHLVVMLSKIRLDMLQEKQRKLKQVILLHCNIAISLQISHMFTFVAHSIKDLFRWFKNEMRAFPFVQM